MPKPEEIAPWATLPAAARERYPRKNVYFTGEGQEDVYDYLIWRANVRGYKTLSGETARGSAEMIHDLLRRAFLRDMLDQDLNDEFVRWRRAQYEAAGIPIGQLDASQTNIPLPNTMQPDTPRFSAFMRARWPVSKALRLAIWVRQEGTCALCRAERRLTIYRDVDASGAASDAYVDHMDVSAAAAIEAAQLVAICEPCRRRMPQRFVPVHDRRA